MYKERTKYPMTKQTVNPYDGTVHMASGLNQIIWKLRRRKLMKLTFLGGSLAIILCAFTGSLPANADTPITDRYGVNGTEPNLTMWVSLIKQKGNIGDSRKTDGFSHPIPVTEQFGALGKDANIKVWYEEIKRTYRIGIL
jgi:hypothetical protein